MTLMTRLRRAVSLVVLGTLIAGGLAGCVFEHRRDGGVAVRPVH
jgi:hypothetical protein